MSKEDSNKQPTPRIVLPSLQDVQAAARTRNVPINLFSQQQTSPQQQAHQQQAPLVAATSKPPPPPNNPLPRDAAIDNAHNNLVLEGGLSGALASLGNPHGPPNLSHSAASQPRGGASQHAPLPPWLSSNMQGSGASVQPPSSYGRPAFAQPTAQAPPPVNCILVNRRQEGNPVLKHIRLMRWQYADIVPDYMVGADSAVLFLSLKFHLLKPNYVHHRIKELQRVFRLRILLCHVDIEDVVQPLAAVTKIAIANECTLFCAWSSEECARYLETFKQYEHKPPDSIRERVEGDYVSKLTNALTSVRGINKTDVVTLARTFGSMGAILRASAEELSACPGIGPTKVRRLHDAFHEPFRRVLRPRGAEGLVQEASRGALQGNQVAGVVNARAQTQAAAGVGESVVNAELQQAYQGGIQGEQVMQHECQQEEAMQHREEQEQVDTQTDTQQEEEVEDPEGGVDYSDAEDEGSLGAVVVMTQAAAEVAARALVEEDGGGSEGEEDEDVDVL